jgi:hypothetical protein
MQTTRRYSSWFGNAQRLRAFRIAICFTALAALCDSPARAASQIAFGNIVRLQPGWVRLYIEAIDPQSGTQIAVVPTCASPGNVNSITTTVGGGLNGFVDFQANLTWLADNGLPQPCTITSIAASLLGSGSAPLVEATETVNIPIDLPLSYLTPNNTQVQPTETSVSLASPSPYAAYPPLLLAIKTVTSVGTQYPRGTPAMSFVEVEELGARTSVGSTVGLRALATFVNLNGVWTLTFELGGGGEMLDGWGLDVVALGIWRAPQLPIEVSNPGHDVFPYSGTVEPPILSGNPGQEIYPAPPLFADADYQTNVLNNRGVPRCFDQVTGCMALKYNQATHALTAVNGATVSVLAPAPVAPAPASPPVVSATGPVASAPGGSSEPSLGGPVLGGGFNPPVEVAMVSTALDLAKVPGRNLAALNAMPRALRSSAHAITSTTTTRDFRKVPPSPQELEVVRKGSRPISLHHPMNGSPPKGSAGYYAPMCIVNTQMNGLTKAPSTCNGLHSGTFACPTVADPVKVDEMGPTTDTQASLYGTIPPYYAGRDNYLGTCETHSHSQYIEALYDKLTDDLAVKRLIYVNGAPIVVPTPRVAISFSGGLADWLEWEGTHSGDPPNNPGYDYGKNKNLPQYPEAYWPAREGNWSAWVAEVQQLKSASANASCTGIWDYGFCIGQGHPGPGVYYTHGMMVQSLNLDPLSDPPWSLADHWFNEIDAPISTADPDAAIQAVIAQIRTGLPVNMGFNVVPLHPASIPGGGDLTVLYGGANGIGWYLPPELAGCSETQLDGVLGLDAGGHSVNIVGYWITGTATSPDIVSSYFIIENNWGKTSGYRSFYFMNFAAFRYLVTTLDTYTLDMFCNSVACARRPPNPIPPSLNSQLQYPPDPSGPSSAGYRALLTAISELPQTKPAPLRQ